MLRRPPTTLQLTQDDLTAYDTSRHRRMHLAAQSRKTAQLHKAQFQQAQRDYRSQCHAEPPSDLQQILERQEHASRKGVQTRYIPNQYATAPHAQVQAQAQAAAEEGDTEPDDSDVEGEGYRGGDEAQDGPLHAHYSSRAAMTQAAGEAEAGEDPGADIEEDSDLSDSHLASRHPPAPSRARPPDRRKVAQQQEQAAPHFRLPRPVGLQATARSRREDGSDEEMPDQDLDDTPSAASQAAAAARRDRRAGKGVRQQPDSLGRGASSELRDGPMGGHDGAVDSSAPNSSMGARPEVKTMTREERERRARQRIMGGAGGASAAGRGGGGGGRGRMGSRG